jgi:hypothetical protein
MIDSFFMYSKSIHFNRSSCKKKTLTFFLLAIFRLCLGISGIREEHDACPAFPASGAGESASSDS